MTTIDINHPVIALLQRAFPTTWRRKLEGTIHESYAKEEESCTKTCLNHCTKIEKYQDIEEEDDEDPGQECYYRRFKIPNKPSTQPKCSDCEKHLEIDNETTFCIPCIWKMALSLKRQSLLNC